jgi:hypothetical protein
LGSAMEGDVLIRAGFRTNGQTIDVMYILIQWKHCPEPNVT